MPLLADVDPLSGLEAVGGLLVIQGNPQLIGLGGLDGVGEVGGWLEVSDNPALTELGLGSLKAVRGSALRILNNPGLICPEGLVQGLDVVPEIVLIEGNGPCE